MNEDSLNPPEIERLVGEGGLRFIEYTDDAFQVEAQLTDEGVIVDVYGLDDYGADETGHIGTFAKTYQDFIDEIVAERGVW